MAVRYVCTGGCGLDVSEKEYKAGKKVCGDKKCPKYGKALTRVMK